MQTIGSQTVMNKGIFGNYDWSAPLSLPQAGHGAVQFVANGADQIFIAISPQAATVSPMYEIAIEAGTTCIRRSAGGGACASVPTSVVQPLSDNPIWVSIDCTTSTIQVGQGYVVGQNTYLSWQDPNFLSTAQFVAFSDGAQENQYIAVKALSLPLQLPGRNGQYDWTVPFVLPVAGRSVISFTANGSHDAMIAISPQAATVNPMYEIVIGGNNNSQSFIRRSAGGPNLASAPAGLIAGGGDTQLWISIDYTTLTIQVGYGLVGFNMFLSWQDPTRSSLGGPDPLQSSCQYFTFSSGSDPVSYSNIQATLKDWSVTFAGNPVKFNPPSSTLTPYAGTQTYTVPSGVNAVLITAIGGRGNHGTATFGSDTYSNGDVGHGAIVSGLFPVTAGQSLYVVVGQDGSAGGLPGGGGGPNVGGGVTYVATVAPSQGTSTDPRLWSAPIDNLLVVAGGGGAGGYGNISGSGGWGGNAGLPGFAGQTGCAGTGSEAGGAGVGATLLNGGSRAGAATEWGDVITWNSGSYLRGGDCNSSNRSAGGGGGGLYGGGAGSPSNSYTGCGGGGGGTSYVAGAVTYRASLALDGSITPSVTITPMNLVIQPPAPGVSIWMNNLPLAGSWNWVSGCTVGYSTAYENADGTLVYGPYWSVPGGSMGALGLLSAKYANPQLVNIGCDPTGRAVARRIYRWFGSSVPQLVGRIPNNVDTTFSDSDPGALLPGTMLSFNDSLGSAVNLGNPAKLNITGPISITAWIYPLATDGLRNIVARGYSTSPIDGEVYLRLAGGNYEVGSWDGSDHCASVPMPAGDVGKWIHLAGVYDGSTWTLYRNGVVVAQATQGTGAVPVAAGWSIGSRGDTQGRLFRGSIGSVSIWNIALTPSHLQQCICSTLIGNESGLMGYWPLNEGNGQRVLDGSANPVAGTLVNTAWAPNIILPSTTLRFNDSSGSAVNLGNPAKLNITGPISIAAWIYPLATDGLRNIVARGWSSSPQGEVSLRIAGGNYEIGSWNGSDCYAVAAIPAGDLGSWVHLAGAFDGSTWTLYRNGQEVARNSGMGPVPVGAGWSIGSRGDTLDRLFRGSIGNVSIWNIAIATDPTTIEPVPNPLQSAFTTPAPTILQQCMNNALTGKEAGLMGYWPLNEGTGQQVLDASANPVVGTLVNAQWVANPTRP